MSDGGPQAGWYPDPENASGLRFWDGTSWTEARHPLMRECAACGTVFDSPVSECPRCAKWQQAGDSLQGCGEAMQGIGCLLTMFVTVPIVLFVLFGLRACG